MDIDIRTIKNPKVKSFYETYLDDRKILRDFYELLSEDKYDYRMVNTPKRKSDSPRESLAHILEVQLMYINGARTGKLEFKDMGVDYYSKMSKSELLDEMDKLDKVMFQYLNNDDFNPDEIVETPWGKVLRISIFYAMRSHEILHQGWNLAIMDHLDMPRYASLKDTWG